LKGTSTVRVDAGIFGVKTIEKGSPVSDALPRSVEGRPVLAAILNNMAVPLETPVICDASAEPLTIVSERGAAAYRDSICFLAAKAATTLFPERKFRVHSALGSALWCTLDPVSENPGGDAAALEKEVKSCISRKATIRTFAKSYAEAVDIFRRGNRTDELNLLSHRNPPVVFLSECEEFYALNQTPLVSDTGCLGKFAISAYHDGFVLRVPDSSSPDGLSPLPESGNPVPIYESSAKKASLMDVETIGDLNRVIIENRFPEYVRTVEAFQTKNLSRIADAAAARSPRVRLVLLAGPSSSGKTTTAHRLCTQLRVNGLRPMILSTDDYFVGDARNPRDENGNLDYETVEAVDRDRLAADLNALFAGKSVRLRKFDFNEHDGFDDSRETVLPPEGVVVLEGIHALNPVLTAGIDDSVKFGIYVNAFTQLAVDSCNRISARDARLLRRMVRDAKYRGMPALETLAMWPSVYRGEKKWIYPFGSRADAVFDSGLDYELAVLKTFAVPLLDQVKPWHREFVTARKLSGLLHNVVAAPADAVPGDSILRESIGGSQLSY